MAIDWSKPSDITDTRSKGQAEEAIAQAQAHPELDDVAPEFTSGVDKNIDKTEAASKAREKALSSSIDWSKPTTKGAIDWSKDKPKDEKDLKLNWAGTGPKQTAKEYFGSGFGGRFVKGAIKGDSDLMTKADVKTRAKLGEQTKDNISQYKDVFTEEFQSLKEERQAKEKAEELAHPTPGVMASLKEFAVQVANDPWGSAKGMIYEMGKDPELAAIGGGGAGALKAATTAAKVGKVAIGAGKGAALGAGLEAGVQVAEGKQLDVQKVINTGSQFAVLGAGMHAIGSLGKGMVPKTEGKGAEDLTFKGKTKEAGETYYETGERIRKQVSQPDHHTAEGVPIFFQPTGKTREDGSYVAALHVRNEDGSSNHIILDKKHIMSTFEDKPWTKPKVEGVFPLAEDAFKTPEEWAEFNLAHEEAHTRVSRPKDVSKADHENVVNEMALNQMKEFRDHPITDQASEVFDPHKDKSPEAVVKEHLRGIIADNWNAENWRSDITKAVPDENIRKRMTMAAEGDKTYDRIYTDKEKHETLNGTGEINRSTGYADQGMNGALKGMRKKLDKLPLSEQEAYQEKINKLSLVISHLEALPSEEHAIPVLESIKTTIKTIGEKATSLGLMDGLRNNYIPHMLDWTEFKGSHSEKMKILDKIYNQPKESRFNRDFTQHRIYETIRDLEEVIKDEKGVVVQRDIAKIAEAYTKAMLKAISEKKMIDHFLGPKEEKFSGTRVFTKDLAEGIKAGYVPYSGVGSKALESILVHPDFKDLIGFVYRQKDPNMFVRGVGAITMLTKSIQTTASLFHFKSLLEAQLIAAPGLMVKELFSGGYGIRQATKAFKEGDKDGGKMIDGWQRNGLVLGTEDIDQTIIGKGGQFVDNQLSRLGPEGTKLHILQNVTNPLDKHVVQNLNKITWDYAHTGGKINTANHFFAKMKAAHPEMSDAKIMQEVSSFVNNTLGGLDWLEVASNTHHKFAKALAMKAAGIQGREWSQILLFAPDWTVSTMRSMSEALPREIMKPQNWKFREGVKGFINPKDRHDLARRYVFNTAVAYLTVMNGINMAFSGHPLWDNKDPFKLDLGDGTTMQMAKHAMEVPEAIHSPGKAIGNKLGFFPKAVSTLTMGRTNPLTATSTVKHDSAFNRFKTVGQSILPFPVSGALSAPTGEGLKRAAWSMAGAPVMGKTTRDKTSLDVNRARAIEAATTRAENKRKKRKVK